MRGREGERGRRGMDERRIRPMSSANTRWWEREEGRETAPQFTSTGWVIHPFFHISRLVGELRVADITIIWCGWVEMSDLISKNKLTKRCTKKG